MAYPTQYGGQLNANEVMTTIFNMIISQQVFSNNISSKKYRNLANRLRVDGTLYGDTKLFYATDTLRTKPFELDSVNQLNLLAIERPKDPACQAIVLDQFRYIELTLDEYFSKRAWSTAAAFADWHGQMLNWLAETKDIFDETMVNAFIGTIESAAGVGDAGEKQHQTVDVSGITAAATTIDDEAKARLMAQYIGEKIDNIFTELADVSRDWNDYGYTRKYSPDDFIVVWNAKYANFMKNVSLPTIFHKEGILNISPENVLPARYFGTVNTSATAGDGSTVRYMNETYLPNETEVDGSTGKDCWAGDLVPSGTTAPANESYTEDGTIICKIIHKDDFPFMSGYRTQKEFINPKNLSTNHYLHFAYNKLQHLHNFPVIDVRLVTA